jgi:hypothetical protein
MSSSSGFCLLPRLPVPSTFPSITCFIRQFLCKMWTIHLHFLGVITCRMCPVFLTVRKTVLPYFSHDWYRWCSPWEFWVTIKLQIHSHCTSFPDQPHFDMRSSDSFIGRVSIGQSHTRTSNFDCWTPWWSILREPFPCHISLSCITFFAQYPPRVNAR